MKKKEKSSEKASRRDFLRSGLVLGAGAVAGTGIIAACSGDAEEEGEKVKVMTTDGKLVEVDSSKLQPAEVSEEAYDEHTQHQPETWA